MTGGGGRGRPPAQFGAIVALALAAAVVPALGQNGASPIRIAVFAFELEDLSPSAVLLQKPIDSAAIMGKVGSAAREELAHSGRYLVTDASELDSQPVADKALRDCNGCEAGLAEQLGAQQSMIGLVRRVTATDYYVMIRIRDARTGKVLDQEEANFAGDETGWASGVRMLIRHQVIPNQQ